jgi:hypothetical protein
MATEIEQNMMRLIGQKTIKQWITDLQDAPMELYVSHLPTTMLGGCLEVQLFAHMTGMHCRIFRKRGEEYNCVFQTSNDTREVTIVANL